MVRVYIIAEVRCYRDALAASLAEARVDVVGVAEHPLQAVSEIRALSADVVLLDLAAPEGPLWVRELGEVTPSTRVLVLGMGEAEHEVVTWAEAGVSGYLGRDASVQELVTAIEGSVRGEAPCHPRTAAILLRRVAAGPMEKRTAWQCDRHLTPREQEMVHLLGKGLSNQQIARSLCIALPTVKNHVHNILEKLGVAGRADAVRAVRRAGFVVRERAAPEHPDLPHRTEAVLRLGRSAVVQGVGAGHQHPARELTMSIEGRQE
jgi:two-component system, NarL family, nitrate/nitrite response regulator NarL